MTIEEKKCMKHIWRKADEPCYCETDEIEDAHMVYYCYKCGIDKCEFLRIRKALRSQKSDLLAKVLAIIDKGNKGQCGICWWGKELKKRISEELAK